MFATPFPVSLTAGLSSHPQRGSRGYLPFAAEDFYVTPLRSEQRFFGLPWPFCWAGGFSPLRTSLPIPFSSFFWFHQTPVRIRCEHRLSTQPVFSSASSEGSDFRALCSSDSSERIGHSAVKGHPLSLEAFAAAHSSSLLPFFFRSTDGGRIPPEYCPSLFAPALASVHAEEFALLPVHWMAAPFP